MAKDLAFINTNDNSKQPYKASSYADMRGVVDFGNLAQFAPYETGYSFLAVINGPAMMNENYNEDGRKDLQDAFITILENEFRGLSGIEDINAEDLIYTDGISELHGVGKVTEQSATEVSMTFTEKSGSTITKFIKYYLNGARDSRTQTKHYHGLIAQGKLALGFENEVFNLLYLVTDASGLGLEAAYLLANAWPNSARTSIYNVEKGNIETKEIDVTFKCFVLQNEEINKRAVKMLAFINENDAVANAASINGSSNEVANLAKQIQSYDENQIEWKSQKYKYKGLSKISKAYGETETI